MRFHPGIHIRLYSVRSGGADWLVVLAGGGTED